MKADHMTMGGRNCGYYFERSGCCVQLVKRERVRGSGGSEGLG